MLRGIAAAAAAAGVVLLGVPGSAQAAGAITVLSAGSPQAHAGLLSVTLEATTPVVASSIEAQMFALGSSTPALTVSDFTLTSGSNTAGRPLPGRTLITGFRVSPRHPRAGTRVKVTGLLDFLTPTRTRVPLSGVRVGIWFRPAGTAAWRVVAAVSTGSGTGPVPPGRFTVWIVVHGSGRFQARYAGTRHEDGCRSAAVPVTVG